MSNDDYHEPMSRSSSSMEHQPDAVPNADTISVETIVTMLVKKNICSAEELFMLEGRIQEQNRLNKKNNFVSIQNNIEHTHHSALKRIMSKRRWTRRLTTALFGWKWKKVKKSPSF